MPDDGDVNPGDRAGRATDGGTSLRDGKLQNRDHQETPMTSCQSVETLRKPEIAHVAMSRLSAFGYDQNGQPEHGGRVI